MIKKRKSEREERKEAGMGMKREVRTEKRQAKDTKREVREIVRWCWWVGRRRMWLKLLTNVLVGGDNWTRMITPKI